MSMKRELNETEDTSDDAVLSLQDIINEDSELETTANAVLGGSDDQACTYSDGYVSRQALYACSTCKTNDRAGVCLACSLECHEGHELYELYTKRNFRCDCGNSKFPDSKCLLYLEKQPINDKNCYNHNFNGTYCTCQRPYPDPEDDVDDEMIQCTICEDWFHGRHLPGKPPASGYSEMICHLCMKNQTNFLWFYNWEYDREYSIHVDVDRVKKEAVLDAGSQQAANAITQLSKDSSDIKKQSSVGEQCADKPVLKKVSDCSLINLMEKFENRVMPESATYWPEQWREQLCKCQKCKTKLSSFKFLFDVEDTVAEYEKKGKEKHNEPSVDSGMRAFSGMSRVQQVEMIEGYNDMKSRLSDFLRTFAEQGKVVKEEDIKSFFQQMSKVKRPRLEMSHYCK